MRNVFTFTLVALLLSLFGQAQVIEGSSGKTIFNISKPEKEAEKPVVEEKPVIKILPKIKWINPENNNAKASTTIFNVSVCIKSEKQINSISFYQNKKLVAERQMETQSFRSDCDFLFNEKVNLVLGKNALKIVVENTDGPAESEITIDFDLMSGKYFALLIGVDDYTDEKINDLDEPIKDASTLYDILTKEYMFDKENVFLMKNPTKSQIVKTLYDMRKMLTSADNLLIFYAGHGYWDEAMQSGYWLPVDAEKDNPVNWFSNSDLRAYIKAIPSKHTLLIADACFSGGIFKTRSAFSDAPVAITEVIKLPSRKAITSGAMNVVPDKSVFMEYFLKRLNDNPDNFLPAEKLFISFKDAVINNSPVNQVPQYGEIREAGDEGGDFIFIRR
ncbi:caspase domain-containing protein [Bacteroidota bacterium]